MQQRTAPVRVLYEDRFKLPQIGITAMTTQRMRDVLQMLTLDDVARKLGVPVSDIRVLVDTDQLPHYRLGHNGEQIRVIRRDLVAFESKTQSLRDQTQSE